jgi:hypothetical protein
MMDMHRESNIVTPSHAFYGVRLCGLFTYPIYYASCHGDSIGIVVRSLTKQILALPFNPLKLYGNQSFFLLKTMYR